MKQSELHPENKTDIQNQSIVTILLIYIDLLPRKITDFLQQIKKTLVFLPNNVADLTVPNILSDLCNHCNLNWFVSLCHSKLQTLAATRCPLRKTGYCRTEYSRANSF